MANKEQVAILNGGVKSWNEWRKQHPKEEIDLSGAYLIERLQGADLQRANLQGVHLALAHLREANMWRVNLREADLSEANLWGANLIEANLERADLSGTQLNFVNLQDANLEGANLCGASLFGSYLQGTNLRNVIFKHTLIARLDLRWAKGLVEISHIGSSFIELQDVQLPQDGSVLHFLRGVGVPDEWIDFYRATMMHPIQYHSCFISYSSKNELLAKRLYADLQGQGVRCWFAPEDMKIGNKIRSHIDEAIHVHDRLLVLLSEHALTSDWVEDEVEAALERERREQREILFPIRLDDAVIQTTASWAATLRRTRHIGDFTKWKKPEAYQSAFTRLLRDLKRRNDE